jgi:hypothetical protein
MLWLEYVPHFALWSSLIASVALAVFGDFYGMPAFLNYMVKLALITQIVFSAIGLVVLNLLPMVD